MDQYYAKNDFTPRYYKFGSLVFGLLDLTFFCELSVRKSSIGEVSSDFGWLVRWRSRRSQIIIFYWRWVWRRGTALTLSRASWWRKGSVAGVRTRENRKVFFCIRGLAWPRDLVNVYRRYGFYDPVIWYAVVPRGRDRWPTRCQDLCLLSKILKDIAAVKL